MAIRAHGHGQADLPLACTLGASDGAERLQRWRALAQKSQPRVSRRSNQVVVRWQLDPRGALELGGLAAAERDCCAFLAWSVTRAGKDCILTVTADPTRPDDVAAVAALFERC